MKRTFFRVFFVLAVLGGLMLSSCDNKGIETEEDGVGLIKLINNSNVTIIYWTAKKSGNKVGESRTPIYSGSSASATINTGSYTIYLEDVDGDGWETRTPYAVKKDKTVEVKFPNDFKLSN